MTEKLLKSEIGQQILSTASIYKIMHRILQKKDKISQDKEHLWMLVLDNSLKIKSIELLSIGSIESVYSNPMEVFSVALSKRAVGIILVHNHPCNELYPSRSDVDMTDRIMQVGRMLQIPLYDKIILGQKDCFSFKDSGMLKQLEMSLRYIPGYKLWDKVKEIISNERYYKRGS